MIFAPADLGLYSLAQSHPHPVLGTPPGYREAGFWDAFDRGAVPFRIEVAPSAAQIFLPPSSILAWQFAKTVRVVASVSFRGFSGSIDRTYPIRIPRASASDYALSEDLARNRLAANQADFATVRADPETGDPVAYSLITDGEQEGAFGEDGYFSWGFEIYLGSFGWTLFDSDESRPPYWGIEISSASNLINMSATSVEEEPEPLDPENPELITYGASVASEDSEVPSDPESALVFDESMVIMGVQVPHLEPSEGSFSIALEIDEYVPF